MKKDLAVIYYLTTKFDHLYQTMLYKLLFYIDFSYFCSMENSLTWSVYYKLPYWPVPLSIKTKIDSIINQESELEMEDPSDEDIPEYRKYISVTKEISSGYVKWIIWGKGNLDISHILNKEEISFIDDVLEKVRCKISEIEKKDVKLNEIKTNSIVQISHEEDAYINADMYQPLFYWFADSLKI